MPNEETKQAATKQVEPLQNVIAGSNLEPYEVKNIGDLNYAHGVYSSISIYHLDADFVYDIVQEVAKKLKRYTKFKSLKINFDTSSIIDNHVKTLGTAFPNTNSLDVTMKYEGSSDQGLEYLSVLTNLEYLHLRSCIGVTYDGLKHLAPLTKLKSLHLDDLEGKSKGLQHLSKLEKLTNLNIYKCKNITDTDIFKLLQVTNITCLTYKEHTYSEQDLKDFKEALSKKYPDLIVHASNDHSNDDSNSMTNNLKRTKPLWSSLINSTKRFRPNNYSENENVPTDEIKFTDLEINRKENENAPTPGMKFK